MSKSILQTNDEECYICGRQWGLEWHHIYAGVANRKVSEANNFKVRLCASCHRGDGGAQYAKELNFRLKQECQAQFEETHTREEFRKLIGKSYL